MSNRVAIVDLGSNSCRMSIFEIDGESYRPVYEVKQNVRLAEGMTGNRRLTDASVERAIACLRQFVRQGALHDVDEWMPVATAALRQAENGDDVRQKIEEETGLRFRILTGEEEARYGFLGVVNTMPIQNAVIFDIGGASSEIALMRDRALIRAASLPYGALNLREMFGRYGEQACVRMASDRAAEALAEHAWVREGELLPLIGLGGTARALAKLFLAETHRKTPRLHGFELPASYVEVKLKQLQQMSVNKRRKMKGIAKHRAEIITTGLAVLATFVRTLKPPSLFVSRCGIREGLLFERLLGSNDPVVPSVLEFSVRNFQRHFRIDRAAAGAVADMAMRLGAELSARLNLDASDRLVLWTAAQLEGAGTFVHPERWRDHAAYLVLHSDLYGLRPAEWQLVAQVVRFDHRDPRAKKLSLLLRLSRWLALELGVEPHEVSRVKGGEIQIETGRRIQDIAEDTADAKVADDIRKALQITCSFRESGSAALTSAR
ncbi:Ppx/GppA phosphatase family protein [Alicyclobacillus acidocaldarius]|uniref:Ppx/GppA phosphatase family protein n=1 Tax=Alicyclobacillus acidocaldarius TaxID=405212 RepID=UPI00345F12FD